MRQHLKLSQERFSRGFGEPIRPAFNAGKTPPVIRSRAANPPELHIKIQQEEANMTVKWPALVAAALGLTIMAGAAEAQTKLKWAHVYETSEPFHTQSVWAAQEISKRTNGRYQIDVYPASQLGKETDINQGLSLGSVDILSRVPASRPQLSADRCDLLPLHFPGCEPPPGIHQERCLQGACPRLCG